MSCNKYYLYQSNNTVVSQEIYRSYYLIFKLQCKWNNKHTWKHALNNYLLVGSTWISINTKNEGKTILNYIYYILFVFLLWNIYELYIFFPRYKYLINKYLTFLIIDFDLYEKIFQSNFCFIWIIILISHKRYLFKLFRLWIMHFKFILKLTLHRYKVFKSSHLFTYK